MKRRTTYNLIAIALAFFVLASTSVSTLQLHFCGNQIAGISLFTADTSCCATDADDCKVLPEEPLGCCQDKTIDLDWDTNIAIQVSTSVDVDMEIVAVLPLSNTVATNSPQSTSTPQAYIPPLRKERKCILFQQFLL